MPEVTPNLEHEMARKRALEQTRIRDRAILAAAQSGEAGPEYQPFSEFQTPPQSPSRTPEQPSAGGAPKFTEEERRQRSEESLTRARERSSEERENQQRLQQERQSGAQAAAAGAPASVRQAAALGTRFLTAQALRWSWLALIPSWGATILYIDFHFVVKYMASNQSFCDFGDEWSIEAEMAREQSGAGDNAVVATTKWGLMYGEIILMVLANIVLLLLITAVLITILIPTIAIASPIGAVWLFIQGLINGK